MRIFLYCNMGHNDIDYEDKTGATLSSTFESDMENRLVIDGLLWLGRKSKKKEREIRAYPEFLSFSENPRLLSVTDIFAAFSFLAKNIYISR